MLALICYKLHNNIECAKREETKIRSTLLGKKKLGYSGVS